MKKEKMKENPMKDYNKTGRNFEMPNDDDGKNTNGAQKLHPGKYPADKQSKKQ